MVRTMTATERAKRFRERDGSERRMPWALTSVAHEGSAILGLAAVGLGVAAFAGAGGGYWVLAGVCAVGALLGWMFVRSA